MEPEIKHVFTREEKLQKFGKGPWLDEPDRIEWRFEGIPCLLTRHPSMGHLCGYVGMTEDHPWFGMNYNDLEEKYEIRVHGGVTYSEPCMGHVCHVPREGESDHVFWQGFDCGHCDDLSPGSRKALREYGTIRPGLIASLEEYETYRDVAYVKAQIELLALQAVMAKKQAQATG